jgi:hypothetical protein
VSDIGTHAVKWTSKNPLITTTVCAVNNEQELEQLIQAGENDITPTEENMLGTYQSAIEKDNHIPFLISAILGREDNRRSLFFGLNNLANAIKFPYPEIPLNSPDSDSMLKNLKQQLIEELKKQGYTNYIRK